MREEWIIVRMDIKKMFHEPKIYILFFFTAFFMADYVNVNSLKDMAEQMNVAVSPFLYPLFNGEWSYRLFTIFVMIMLMSDVPFQDELGLYMVQRMGTGKWMKGKICSIIAVAVIYQAFSAIISMLVLLPDLGISVCWGDVLGMMAENHMQMWASTGNTGSARYIIDHYEAWQALIYTMLLSILISSLTGFFIFLINQVTKSQLGLVLALIYSCIDLLFGTLNDFGYPNHVPFVMSWMDLSCLYTNQYQTGKTSLYTAFIFLLAANVILIYILKKCAKYAVIQPVEGA